MGFLVENDDYDDDDGEGYDDCNCHDDGDDDDDDDDLVYDVAHESVLSMIMIMPMLRKT